MNITHYCNSFISVKFSNDLLFCDPWTGITKDNGWISHPIETSILKKLAKPNYIYISHLHADHFDEKTLKIINKNQKIIIKDFKIKILKKRLENLGFSKIIELKPWKKYIFNEFELAIIPQITSNNASLEEQISYDLDTSIVIKCLKTDKIFYNNVDNPLSVKDFEKVNNFIKKNFKSRVSILCLGVGAASEYPQCFLNINRKKEKEKIIKKSLIKLKRSLNIFKPDIFFPAGGTYKIYGKFHNLNNLIAQASFRSICKVYVKNVLCKNLIGGKSINIIDNTIRSTLKTNNVKNYSRKKYFYHNNNYEITKLDDLFLLAKNNYYKKLLNKKIKTSWNIKFYIYKNLNLNKKKQINKKKSIFLKKYEINFNSKNIKKNTNLSCYLDASLFFGLLKRKYIWNSAVSGSLILYKRHPNIFDPNVTFSLNYLNS